MDFYTSHTMRNYQNIRVRAYLQTSVVSDKFLPLDGILFYHFIRENFGAEEYTLARESNEKIYSGLKLPILPCGMRNKDDAWFYACSFAQFPEDTIESSYDYSKRFDFQHAEYIQDKKAVVDIQRGKYKNYHITEYTRNAVYVDWFLNADKEKIENLLKFCTHIGKKTSQGMGAVLRWEVEEWHSDWSIRGENNKLMRAVPNEKSPYIYGLRPSYWHPRHQYKCIIPL